MYAIGFSSALHGTISGNLFWKTWRDQGRTFQQRTLEREQPLYCHWPVRTIVYCLLFTLCGQLDSINECLHSKAICHTLCLSLTSFSLHRTHPYLCISHGACVQCYIGP